jgi:hypothetical protein
MYAEEHTVVLSIHVTRPFVTAVNFVGFYFGMFLVPLMGCHAVEWPLECGAVACGRRCLHLAEVVDGNTRQRSKQNQ